MSDKDRAKAVEKNEYPMDNLIRTQQGSINDRSKIKT